MLHKADDSDQFVQRYIRLLYHSSLLPSKHVKPEQKIRV